MLTVSAGVTNPALEPEHFLFPDIILSSNLGGDVALVEPMVCLLVSEEEEGGGEGVRVDEGQERSNRGRNRGYSEVETQTEVETQIGMGVQTQTESQTEVQTQTEMLVCRNETVEREVNTLINTGVAKEIVVDILEDHGILKQMDMLMEAQTSHGIHSDKQEKVDVFEKLEVPGKVEIQTERKTLVFSGITEEGISDEKQKTIQDNVFKLQQNTVAVQENTDFAYTEQCTLQTQEKVKEREQNIESERKSVILTEHNVNRMDGNIAAAEKTTINNTEIMEHLGPAEKDHDDIHSKTKLNLSADQSIDSADQIQSKENLHPAKREEDDDTPGLQQVEEEGADRKKVTLFLVDRLFLAAPHVKGVSLYAFVYEAFSCGLYNGSSYILLSSSHPYFVSSTLLSAAPPSQTEEIPKDDHPEQSDVDKRKQLSIRDIVDLQETGFTVRIQPPGTESFELQVPLYYSHDYY